MRANPYRLYWLSYGGGGARLSEFQRYPKYFGIYWRACGKAMKHRQEKGLEAKYQDIAHNMAWWLEYKDFAEFVNDYAEIIETNGFDVPKVDKRQMDISDFIETP
jgi:hypothetical protein